jgi:hypothetical protein
MDAITKTPNAKKPLDSPPRMQRKSDGGLPRVFLVIRGCGLINAAYYSRNEAEIAASKIVGGSVLAHDARAVTTTDGRTTAMLEGGGFSEVVEIMDA